MKWISTSLSKAIRTSPFFGRTLAVLAFLVLPIKQIFIFLTYAEVFKETTLSATWQHYLGYFVSDFLLCLIILGLVVINVLVKKTFIKIINNIVISILFLLFLLDI
ncbi:MAG: hypothetical protein WCJ45_07675 [bacterium]